MNKQDEIAECKEIEEKFCDSPFRANLELKRVAERGNVEAMRKVAYAYLNSSDTNNTDKAVWWYKMAAQRGDEVSQQKLAELGVSDTAPKMTKEEEIVECKNINNYHCDHAGRMLYYYIDAAKRGNVEAMKESASFCLEGWGDPKDIRKATFWYENAAARGDEGAKKMLQEIKDGKHNS